MIGRTSLGVQSGSFSSLVILRQHSFLQKIHTIVFIGNFIQIWRMKLATKKIKKSCKKLGFFHKTSATVYKNFEILLPSRGIVKYLKI